MGLSIIVETLWAPIGVILNSAGKMKLWIHQLANVRRLVVRLVMRHEMDDVKVGLSELLVFEDLIYLVKILLSFKYLKFKANLNLYIIAF